MINYTTYTTMKTLKAILTITLATLAFSACTSDVENESKRTPVKLRSQTEAINIAENAYSVFNSGKSSRAGHATTATASDVQIIKGRSSRGVANDTLLYIVNFENNEGFAVVSASNATEPLFGIADEGNFDLAQAASNSNFNYYLECASEYVSNSMNMEGISIPSGPIGPSIPGGPTDSLITNYTITASKGPYVNFKWGQGSPYGDNFENGNCGSLASVIAMIALTVHWPVDIDRWGVLSSHISNGEGCTEDSSLVHPKIARFMENDITYNFQYECQADETIYTIPIGLEHFWLPTAYGQCYRIEDCDSVAPIIAHLDAYETEHHNTFVFATTGSLYNDYYEKIEHCWLIDGYKTISIALPIHFPNNHQEYQTETFLHCNWACDGNGNGFFLPTSNFNTVLNYDRQGSAPVYSINNSVTYHLLCRDILC